MVLRGRKPIGTFKSLNAINRQTIRCFENEIDCKQAKELRAVEMSTWRATDR